MTHIGRWGLLWAAVALAVLLVGSTVWVRAGIVAHEPELAVIHGVQMWSARDSSLPLRDQFEQLRRMGVHGLTRYDDSGQILETVGENLASGRQSRRGPISLRPGLYQIETADNDSTLVAEYRPLLAGDLWSRANKGVALSIASSGLLVLFVFLWTRHRLRLESVREEAEKNRHLAHLGTLSAVIAHELRNPLTVLLGHVQLVREDLPEDRSLQYVESSAVRLDALLESLLRFARTGEVTRSHVEPVALLQSVVVDIEGPVIEVQGEAPAWSLDGMRMGQVLRNLLTNAREASPRGAVEAHVSVEQDVLIFDIRDDGEGIPAGMHEALFEPFHTTRVHGTGLGLAVARDIVEKHAGTLVAMDAPGGGAWFRVAVPNQEVL